MRKQMLSLRDLFAIFWQIEIFLKNFNFWHFIWGKGVIRLFNPWSFFHQLHRLGENPTSRSIPAVFNFGHLGFSRMPKFIACPGLSQYLLPTYFRHQPKRSQLASQLANEEPALFWDIYILQRQWQRQRQRQWTDSKGNTTTLDISQWGASFICPYIYTLHLTWPKFQNS